MVSITKRVIILALREKAIVARMEMRCAKGGEGRDEMGIKVVNVLCCQESRIPNRGLLSSAVGRWACYCAVDVAIDEMQKRMK